MYKIMNMIAIAGFSAVLLSSTPAPRQAASQHDAIEAIEQTTRTKEQEGTDSLLQYFNETTNELEKQVSGLSEAQLQFKSAPDKWSISQCLEHIVLSERMIFDMAKAALTKAPQPERKSEVQMTDDNLKTTITDRSHKFQAPKELQPTGIYKDSKTALADFRAARQPVIDYITKADAKDLRSHINDYPTGVVDGYQGLMFIAAHCARHTKQIAEVKADPNFPKQ
ncbi:DinB family protein [Sphingobacterium athyrii]|uniref:DinB family protein n=1 Tax=Sphingobacterium athyrii TaxID=2152717 RepID=A0A363NV19_9SPHI|nr:DinB family protein [Sphingobacterium athyrii]PUV24665.1 DinB family protein [Sphingobacterium athyrii]